MKSEWSLAITAAIGGFTAGSTAQSFSPLSDNQQVGNSLLGTLSQPTFPRWLGDDTQPPWGDRTTKDAIVGWPGNVPVTNVTRYYNWTISRTQLSPDGVLRDVIVINDQFPGPLIEANWGDEIAVTVYNNITGPEEGTSIHWHGSLQRGTQWMDGVPGVSSLLLLYFVASVIVVSDQS